MSSKDIRGVAVFTGTASAGIFLLFAVVAGAFRSSFEPILGVLAAITAILIFLVTYEASKMFLGASTSMAMSRIELKVGGLLICVCLVGFGVLAAMS